MSIGSLSWTHHTCESQACALLGRPTFTHCQHLSRAEHAFARGASVLLDDTRLEGHGLLEARCELLGCVVGQRVFQADVHRSHLAKRILCTHLFHHIWGWPNLDAGLAKGTHPIIELLLISPVGFDLPRVATNDNEIKLLAKGEESVVFLMRIVDQLARHACVNHAVGHGDGVIAVPIVALDVHNCDPISY